MSPVIIFHIIWLICEHLCYGIKFMTMVVGQFWKTIESREAAKIIRGLICLRILNLPPVTLFNQRSSEQFSMQHSKITTGSLGCIVSTNVPLNFCNGAIRLWKGYNYSRNSCTPQINHFHNQKYCNKTRFSDFFIPIAQVFVQPTMKNSEQF